MRAVRVREEARVAGAGEEVSAVGAAGERAAAAAGVWRRRSRPRCDGRARANGGPRWPRGLGDWTESIATEANATPLFGQHSSHGASLLLRIMSSHRASSTDMSADQP